VNSTDAEKRLNQISVDVAVIRERIEAIPDHEVRIRKLEKRTWGVPASLFAAVLALFGVHHT
jgi:hypothetical protein